MKSAKRNGKKKKVVRVPVLSRSVQKRVKLQAVAAVEERTYRVDMERQLKDSSGKVTGYIFTAYSSLHGTDEKMARSLMAYLKRMYTGGRLVWLDGSPEGKIEEEWASVGRVLQAEAIEKPLLEK